MTSQDRRTFVNRPGDNHIDVRLGDASGSIDFVISWRPESPEPYVSVFKFAWSAFDTCADVFGWLGKNPQASRDEVAQALTVLGYEDDTEHSLAVAPETGPRVVNARVEAHHPVEPGTNRRHTWVEFREAGMLWVANRVLHLFGWTIVMVVDDETDELKGAHPARTEWRGFPRDREELGYTRVSEWMAKAGAAILEETKR